MSVTHSDLVEAIERAQPRLGGTVLVAVDGPSGAGKSDLARAVKERLSDAVVVSCDDFATWADPVSWWPRLRVGVLDRLAAGLPARYQVNDWSDGAPKPGPLRTFDPPKTLVIEGVSALRQAVSAYVSVGVWLPGPPADERLTRTVARDGEKEREQLARWQHFEAGWFAVDRPWRRATPSFTVDTFAPCGWENRRCVTG